MLDVALTAAIVVANLVVFLVAAVLRRSRRGRAGSAAHAPAGHRATGDPATGPAGDPAIGHPTAGDPAGGDPPGGSVSGAGPGTPSFRVVALGLQGSGKTLLLASMYRRLQTPGDRGFYLRAPYQQLIELNRWYQQVANPEVDWPRGTSRGELREFEFDVMTDVGQDAEPVLRIGYLEYPGELLTDQDAPGSTAQARLLAAIAGADALLGIIDGLRLRQAYHGEVRGMMIVQAALDTMIHAMLAARCPVAFVITKWDLLDDLHQDENARLDVVRDLLMSVDGFRDLVRVQGTRRVIRLVPVTAVGHDFAVLDGGEVRKRPDGRFRPANVDVPLSAVVPDVLRQVELSLDTATREEILAEAHRRLRMGPLEALQSLAAFAGRRAGRALLAAMGGGVLTDSALALFLDSRVAPEPAQARRLAELDAAGRRADELVRARRRVLYELQNRVSVLEASLPSSRLDAQAWRDGALR